MPVSADSKNKRVANSSPVTRQTLRQQGGTGEGSHIHLADWTLSVAAIDKKKEIDLGSCRTALPAGLPDSPESESRSLACWSDTPQDEGKLQALHGVRHTVLPLTTAITGYARGLKAVS